MSVWSTVDTIKNCEKKRDDARQSAQNLEQLVANSTEHLEKTKESYQQGQGVRYDMETHMERRPLSVGKYSMYVDKWSVSRKLLVKGVLSSR